MAEIWDLYDARRNLTGETVQSGTELPDGSYHLAVHGWIINKNGEALMTQRHPSLSSPMLWEGISGAALAGETSGQAMLREIKEVTGAELSLLDGRRMQSIRRGSSFIDVWVFNGELNVNKLNLAENRVVSAKWVSPELFADMFRQKRILPSLYYFPSLYKRVQKNGI